MTLNLCFAKVGYRGIDTLDHRVCTAVLGNNAFIQGEKRQFIKYISPPFPGSTLSLSPSVTQQLNCASKRDFCVFTGL